MPIKSVHLTNYYHRNSGGISTSYNQLLDAANRHRRFVRLIVPGEETTVEEVGEFGRIYYIKSDPAPLFDKRYRLMMPWKTFMLEGSPVKSIIREEKPDLIEIGEKYTISLMAGLVRKRIVNFAPERPILVHSSCERMDDNIRAFVSRSRIVAWLARLYMANYNVPMFDFHLANSTYTLDEIVSANPAANAGSIEKKFNDIWQKFWRTPKVDLSERLFINQCGADLEIFSPARRSDEKRKEILRQFELAEDTRLLLYAGRLSPEKNLVLLPHVMRKLVETGDSRSHLLIVGTGPYSDELKSQCDQMCSGRVTFGGQVADKEHLADIYANSHAFVHSNPCEPFGIAPLEAMASGIPLVAPNSGGILSYASAENAWLSDPTPAGFVQALAAIETDSDARQSKLLCALETSSRYSWERSTDDRFASYDKMYDAFSQKRDLYDYVPGPISAPTIQLSR